MANHNRLLSTPSVRQYPWILYSPNCQGTTLPLLGLENVPRRYIMLVYVTTGSMFVTFVEHWSSICRQNVPIIPEQKLKQYFAFKETYLKSTTASRVPHQRCHFRQEFVLGRQYTSSSHLPSFPFLLEQPISKKRSCFCAELLAQPLLIDDVTYTTEKITKNMTFKKEVALIIMW